MNTFIDINADVGEGFNNEAQLMPFLSSCSIACGGHAGDKSTMLNVLGLAKKYNVKVGAHPSFPDKVNFGRINMKISEDDLYASILNQISVLKTIAESEGIKLHHIKPHGALYNLAVIDKSIAKVIVKAIKSIGDKSLKLYAPYNSIIASIAKQEAVEVVFEAFADRSYNEDLTLVSRQNKHAVLTDNNVVLNHIIPIIKYQKVKALNGVEVAIKATTFCVHSDTENAIEILEFLNKKLPENGITIQ